MEHYELAMQPGGQYEGLLVGKEGTAQQCIECGICVRECTQHLPIIERLKEFSQWS